jgi:hypothetical protein
VWPIRSVLTIRAMRRVSRARRVGVLVVPVAHLVRVEMRAASCVSGGWRGVGEQQPEIVSLDDLRHVARLDVADFDKGRFEGEYVGIVKSCFVFASSEILSIDVT